MSVKITTTDLLGVQFPPHPCPFIPLESKYYPKHPVLLHPQTNWEQVRKQLHLEDYAE
jgi:hypothetical protein